MGRPPCEFIFIFKYVQSSPIPERYFIYLLNQYLNPAQANAPKPTAIVRQMMTAVGVTKYAANIMKMVCDTKAPQLNNFRT